MEIELNDLKSRIDSDVMESRALEEQASAIPQLEVNLLGPPLFAGTLSRAILYRHVMNTMVME